jgi:hypothetical protein
MKTTCAVFTLLLALALAACGEEPKPSVANLSTREAQNESQVSISGTGKLVSPAFRVKLRGTYKVYWKSAKQADAPNDPAGCPIKADMGSATEGMGFHRLLTGQGTDSTDRPGMMESRPFSLEAQSYFVDVDTQCTWLLTLDRQFSQ